MFEREGRSDWRAGHAYEKGFHHRSRVRIGSPGLLYFKRKVARRPQRHNVCLNLFAPAARNEVESFEGARLTRDEGLWRGPPVEGRQAAAT